tara:strand:+ start:144 stop:614 length:471 start_codon:yes stop_codon:yes gene_type:complete
MAFQKDTRDHSSLAARLEKTSYHSLKEALEKEGLGSVWKGGKKKVDIIKEAIAKVAEVKKMQDQDLSQDEIDSTLALKDAEEKAKEEVKIAHEAQEEVTNIDAEVAKLVETRTLEQLERGLQIIKGNIAGGISSHRHSLIIKRDHHIRAIKIKQKE